MGTVVRLDTAKSPRRSTISLTPLIDVVFILLLFFMLTSRFQHYQAMPLNVPASDTINTNQSERNALSINLQSNGTIAINGAAPVDQKELATSVLVVEAMQDELPVIVSTGADVTLSALTQLMDRLSAAGLTSVSLRGVR